jgi:hypothetical protein
LNWPASRAKKMSLHSPKSFAASARASFMLLTVFFAIAVKPKKPRRKLS